VWAGPGRVGLWYVLVLGAGGALALARHVGLDAAATAVALLTTVGPAYLGWKAFYYDRAEAAIMDLEAAADHLARAVKKQWDDEMQIRRVNDPYPLPVAWRAADADLVEPWPLLGELARAWPGGPPGDPACWPAQAAGLAGSDAQIGEVFTQRVPTRRLVVFGEPGAGKSALLIRLLQELIEQRPQGGLVPVLFSLASWDPARQPLQEWLAGQLRRSHPGLRAPAPSHAIGLRAGRYDLARALLDARRILPLLDGFDELPPHLAPWPSTPLTAPCRRNSPWWWPAAPPNSAQLSPGPTLWCGSPALPASTYSRSPVTRSPPTFAVTPAARTPPPQTGGPTWSPTWALTPPSGRL
jgi:hypothetical protein